MQAIARGIRCAGVLVLMLTGMQSAKAQVTQSGGGYLFRQKYSKGQVIRYAINGSSSGAGQNMKITMGMTMKVTAVKNGVATVVMTRDAGSMNGKSLGKAETVTLRMDNRGHVIGDGSGQGLEGLSAVLPEKPIRIGETFTTNTGAMSGGMGQNVKATFKFLGLKTYNGQKVAQFTTSGTVSGQVQAKSTGFMLISVADGQLVSAKTDTSVAANQKGNKSNISFRMNVERK